MYVPRLRTNCTASENVSEPAATSAEYSPKLCPATKSGSNPCSAATRNTATEQLKIAGWVFAVCFNSSSVPSKHIFEMENPSAWSASSNTARATAYFSASSLPIPGYCEACPGKTNATFPMLFIRRRPSFALCALGDQRQLLFDLLVHVGLGQSRRHANRVFNRVRVRTAVPDNAHSPHSQKRRTAILRVVN